MVGDIACAARLAADLLDPEERSEEDEEVGASCGTSEESC
jgi:hypothetical protein